MSSKRYPEEFKIEAVRQVTERGHSVAEVAVVSVPPHTACMHG
ncbi:Transposase [Neptunomonas qingdaonensis]|uniref:Transposase n=1 Tax=Neptunomonas qingdaonensis TaxID=1045558 RepID=A0A1I2Q5R9_9GAMM|nr:Transposase [Neptunomonas qingdaonensis]